MTVERTLYERVILITGASQGVGRATAAMLVAQGARVGMIARDEQRLRTAAQDVDAGADRALPISGDVGDEVAMEAAVEQVVQRFGGLDAIIINAAIRSHGSVENLALADWEAAIRTNLTGAFICARAAVPALRARGGGNIIAISSGAGKQGYPNMSAYCASKFGLIGFMESLAGEVKDAGIHCSTICPGSILTDFGGRSAAEKASASGARFISPDDVATAIVYLLQQPRRAWTQEMNLWPF